MVWFHWHGAAGFSWSRIMKIPLVRTVGREFTLNTGDDGPASLSLSLATTRLLFGAFPPFDALGFLL